ncbi:MAG: ATP-binding protein [Marinifilaceae bacterium]|jgi:PAS domain S-box-containing protein|nr:ATP-binding protein [Marinifilaceae bacterium]
MNDKLKELVQKYLSEKDKKEMTYFLESVDNYVSSLKMENRHNDESETTTDNSLKNNIPNFIDNSFSISEVLISLNKEGLIQNTNSVWRKLTGYSNEETIGKSFSYFIHPQDNHIAEYYFDNLQYFENQYDPIEFRLICKNANYLWCELGTDPEFTNLDNNIHCYINDISQRKAFEFEKIFLEEKYYTIFEKSNTPYLIANSNKILDCNEACLDLFGLDNKEYFLNNFIQKYNNSAILNSADTPGSNIQSELDIAKKEGHHNFEWVFYRDNGMEFHAEIRLNHLFNNNESLFFLIIHDLTKYKHFEQELVLAKEKAEDAAKAKAQFLSTMSHEIRTPMNAVIGITHLLSEGNPREDQIENINILRYSAENLMSLLDDILDFGKIEEDKIKLENKPINIISTIKNTIGNWIPKAHEKNLDFYLDIDYDIPINLLGDGNRIEQVINNICCNAIKFTDAGYVKFTARLKRKTKNKTILECSIEDTGIGIPRNKVNKIFDAFTQADSNNTRMYGGMGLGLSISKKLIKLMGGTIKLRSQESKGTCFYFTLKLDNDKFSENTISETKPKNLNFEKLQGIHVLIVEDNLTNVLVMQQLLKKWKINFDVVENGKLACEKVQKSYYDLVLMDLQMPVMDGYSATKKIRSFKNKRVKNIPIIAITASDYYKLEEEIYEVGMNEIVGKPINPVELFVKMEKFT